MVNEIGFCNILIKLAFLVSYQIYLTQSQLAYGQLHAAYEKVGDTVRSIEYLANELHAHYYVLSWKSKVFPYINFTKLNLFLNLVSNDFGRNWARAIGIAVFIVGVPLFYALTISTVEYSFGFPLSLDSHFIGAFLRFMNPLRNLEIENIFDPVKTGLGLTGISYVIDFIGES